MSILPNNWRTRIIFIFNGLLRKLLQNFLKIRPSVSVDGEDARLCRQPTVVVRANVLFAFSVIFVFLVIFLARLGCPPDD